MKESINNKKALVHAWRKALVAVNPQLAAKKKRLTAA
jgi:hypothetical protein